MATTDHLFCVVAALVLAGATLGVAPPANAQDDPEDFGDTIHVVQPKPVLQQGRVNLTPQAGMTINDPLYRGYTFGGRGSFHLTERFHLGALFQWHDRHLLGGDTQTYRDVAGETQTAVDATFLRWGTVGEVGFSPLFGKYSLFNRGIIFYNVSVTAGGGWVSSASLGAPGANRGGPAGTVSLGAQFFFNDWMGFDVEIRDVIYQGRIQGAGDVLSHSVTLGVGVNFLFPQSFEYEEAETL